MPGKATVRLKEVWTHTCPLHGEEECFASRSSETQIHQCRTVAQTRIIQWNGPSTRTFKETKNVTKEKVGLPE